MVEPAVEAILLALLGGKRSREGGVEHSQHGVLPLDPGGRLPRFAAGLSRPALRRRDANLVEPVRRSPASERAAGPVRGLVQEQAPCRKALLRNSLPAGRSPRDQADGTPARPCGSSRQPWPWGTAFCHEAAQQMQALTGFDRVRIYTFHPDGTGEVIAEMLRAGKLWGLGAAWVDVAPCVDDALRIIDAAPPGFAVLDVNLGHETSFPEADRLRSLGVTFAFATGYGKTSTAPGAWLSEEKAVWLGR